MTHTPSRKSLRFLSTVAYLVGVTSMTSGSAMQAQLSGIGSTAADIKILQPAARTIILEHQSDAAAQLALGILLVILTLSINVLAHMRDEKPVRVTVKPKKRRSWFWVEMRV